MCQGPDVFGEQGWFFQNGSGLNDTAGFSMAPSPWALAPGQLDDYDPDMNGERVCTRCRHLLAGSGQEHIIVSVQTISRALPSLTALSLVSVQRYLPAAAQGCSQPTSGVVAESFHAERLKERGSYCDSLVPLVSA